MLTFSPNVSSNLSTAILCPALPNVTNGAISYSIGGADEFPDSTVATYLCNNGYRLHGEPERTCSLPDGALAGEFNGEEPRCVRKCLALFNRV